MIPVLMLTAIMTSCEEEDKNTDPPANYNSEGVYIINEGGFMAGNASVSYLNLENMAMTGDIFQSVNGFPLGDVAQSMTINNGKGYIIVNNSQKVEVVNLTDFTLQATVSGFSGPRYMAVWNNKGYVTDWFSDEVKVVDLGSNTIIKSIPAGTGPEHLCIASNKVYVANIGGFTSDSTVTVINANTDSVQGRKMEYWDRIRLPGLC